jgi:hypothetical protein
VQDLHRHIARAEAPLASMVESSPHFPALEMNQDSLIIIRQVFIDGPPKDF